MKGKLQRSSRESRWSMRSTLLGGTRTKIHDRKGWVASSERPHGRDEISSCHRPKTHCRVVQGTVREVKAEHTPTYTTAKEKQGNLSGNR